jgi:hypothetical protein
MNPLGHAGSSIRSRLIYKKRNSWSADTSQRAGGFLIYPEKAYKSGAERNFPGPDRDEAQGKPEKALPGRIAELERKLDERSDATDPGGPESRLDREEMRIGPKVEKQARAILGHAIRSEWDEYAGVIEEIG